jgi:hypothetical protein
MRDIQDANEMSKSEQLSIHSNSLNQNNHNINNFRHTPQQKNNVNK